MTRYVCNFVPMYKTYIETKHENRDRSIGNGIGWLFTDMPSYIFSHCDLAVYHISCTSNVLTFFSVLISTCRNPSNMLGSSDWRTYLYHAKICENTIKVQLNFNGSNFLRPWKFVLDMGILSHQGFCLFVLRFYGPVNPMGSCRARSVYLTTRLLGRLSPPSG